MIYPSQDRPDHEFITSRGTTVTEWVVIRNRCADADMDPLPAIADKPYWRSQERKRNPRKR